jgi:hypothetical protein
LYLERLGGVLAQPPTPDFIRDQLRALLLEPLDAETGVTMGSLVQHAFGVEDPLYALAVFTGFTPSPPEAPAAMAGLTEEQAADARALVQKQLAFKPGSWSEEVLTQPDIAGALVLMASAMLTHVPQMRAYLGRNT